MAKGDKFYFDNFKESTSLSKQAALYLVECLENYDPNNIQTMLEQMHAIEHQADTKKHEMREALARAFVTPVDREDLDMLSHQLDEVVDKIEEVLQEFYICSIRTVKPDAVTFAKNIVNACAQLCTLMDEFENFKRSKKIKEMIIGLNDVEEACDQLYLSAMHTLTSEHTDVLEIISWRNIFDCLESCADACEHVSECVGSVIMKNT